MPWFGPPRGAEIGTARFMETWAHSLDVAEALGIEAVPRLTGSGTWPPSVSGTHNFSFGVRSLPPPAEEFTIELVAPSGDVWAVGGPEDAAQSVRGSAHDFCLRVAQRGTGTTSRPGSPSGATPTAALVVAEAFAGPWVLVARRRHDRDPPRRQLHGFSTATACPRSRAPRGCPRGRAEPQGRHHRRLPRRADHADPGQGPLKRTRAQLRPHVRHAGRRLPGAGAGAGRTGIVSNASRGPCRAGRQAHRGRGRPQFSRRRSRGSTGRPGTARRRARPRRSPDRQRLPGHLARRPGARGRLDIVVTGRVTNASVVVGPAIWRFG